MSAASSPGSTTRVEIVAGATRTTLTLGTPGPRGLSYPEQLFDADLIDTPSLDATNDFLRAPAVDATDAANASATLATTKAGLADQAAQAAQAVVDAGASIMTAAAATDSNRAIVQAIVAQPDITQRSTVQGILLAGDIPAGAAQLGADGNGRMISAMAADGLNLLPVHDAANRDLIIRTLLPGDFGVPGATPQVGGDMRLVQATCANGQPLFAMARDRTYVTVLPGDLPAGTDPVVSADGTGRIIALTSPSAWLDTPTMSLLPGDNAPGGLIDTSGRPLPGAVDPNSGLVANRKSAFPSGIPYIAGTSPNRQARLWLGGSNDILVSFPGADPDIVGWSGDSIIYRRNTLAWAGDTANRKEGESLAPEVVAAGTTRVRFVMFYGQSNSCGYGPVSTVYSNAPVRPGRALTFGIGPRMMPEDVPNGSPLPMEYLASWRDLREFSETRPAYATQSIIKPGETPCSGLGYQMTQLGVTPATDALLTATMGVGSQTIQNLAQGTHAYVNLLRAVHSATVKAARLGLPFDVPCVVWIQGESNTATDLATYTTLLASLQTNLDTDIRAITGQSNTVILIGAQTASWTFANLTRSDVPTAILNLALAYPSRFACSGPMYQYPFPIGLHLSAYGQRMHGEQIGRAAARKLNGTAQPMLYCASATLSGQTVIATMAGAEGNLVLDTAFVTDPGNYGIAFLQDGGNTVTIGGTITVSGTDKVTIPLSAIPTGTNQRIEFARTGIAGANGGPTTGPRCCLRDTVAALRSDGTPMHKYACIQSISLS